MAVTKRTRYEVLRRDNHQCRYCGAAAPDVELTVDHVVAIALGGPDEPSNLVAACVDCNAGKSSTTVDAELVADVAQWALTWRAAVAAAAEEMLHSQFVIGSISEELDSRWGDFRAGTHEVPKESFDQLVTAFLAAGITPQHTQDLLLDSIQVAMRNKSVKFAGVWKYFCGVAYTKLRRVHENAIV